MSNKRKFPDTGDLQSDEVTSEFDSNDDAEFGWVLFILPNFRDDSSFLPFQITYFLSLKGNEFFCQIDEDYIHDNFNLTGLASMVPYYDFALDLITDMDNGRQIFLFFYLLF